MIRALRTAAASLARHEPDIARVAGICLVAASLFQEPQAQLACAVYGFGLWTVGTLTEVIRRPKGPQA